VETTAPKRHRGTAAPVDSCALGAASGEEDHSMAVCSVWGRQPGQSGRQRHLCPLRCWDGAVRKLRIPIGLGGGFEFDCLLDVM